MVGFPGLMSAIFAQGGVYRKSRVVFFSGTMFAILWPHILGPSLCHFFLFFFTQCIRQFPHHCLNQIKDRVLDFNQNLTRVGQECGPRFKRQKKIEIPNSKIWARIQLKRFQY